MRNQYLTDRRFKSYSLVLVNICTSNLVLEAWACSCASTFGLGAVRAITKKIDPDIVSGKAVSN